MFVVWSRSRVLKASLIPLALVGLFAVAVPSNASSPTGGTDGAARMGDGSSRSAVTASARETGSAQEVGGASQSASSWGTYFYGKPMGQGRLAYAASKDGKCQPRKDKFRRGLKDLRRLHVGLPAGQDWNNRISSVYLGAGLYTCEFKLFGRPHYRGQHTKWIDHGVARLGKLPTGWNNAASSIKLRAIN